MLINQLISNSCAFQFKNLGIENIFQVIQMSYYYLKMKEYKKKKLKKCKLNERISWRATRIILLKTFLKNKLSSVTSLASEDGLFNWKAFYEI